MKAIQAILDLARATNASEPLAMATVVKVRGSAYRRPGARMLVTASGCTAGMISGGCLENDARYRCHETMETGESRVITYDSTAPEDIVFGLGLGCNGIVQVLIEPLGAGRDAGLLPFFEACVARRQIGRAATVFHSDDFPVGARLLRWPDGSLTTNFEDRALSAALAKGLFESGARRNAVRRLELPDGRSACALLEAVTPPVSLTIFGAADDAVPAVQLAKLLGWHVTVIDARPAYATKERFPKADAVHCLRPEAVAATTQVILPPDALVMVMTHNFTHDLTLLRMLLLRPLRYLGILGPKSRTERLLADLASEGCSFRDEALARLHGPAGLDLGAETPEEIAVSIIAEMQAALGERPGGALRDRNAPIHDPAEHLDGHT